MNEDYQNLVGSYQGIIPSPVYPIPPDSFMFGGNLGILSDGEIDVVGIQQASALVCATSIINEVSLTDLKTEFFVNIINNDGSKSSVSYASYKFLKLGVGATISASNFGSVYITLNPSLALVENEFLGSGDADEDNMFPRSLLINPTGEAEMFSIVQTMLQFNWTLVVPIFELAYDNLFNVNYFAKAATAFNVNTTCNSYYSPGSDLADVADCIVNSQANLVLIWSTMENAVTIIEYFYNYGSGLENIVFIGGDSWFPFVSYPNFSRGKFPASYLEGSIGVLPLVNNRLELFQCIQTELQSSSRNPLFVQMWENMYNCTLPTEENTITDKNICQTNIGFPQFGLTFSTASFVYDAVYEIYEALWQITYNCSGISKFLPYDACDLDYINGYNIDAVVKLGNLRLLTRYNSTGFDQSFQVFQANDTNHLESIGVAMWNSSVINMTNLYWKNGEQPLSEIIPYEPSLTEDSGILALVLLIIGWLVNGFLIIYFYLNRKERVIKRTSHIFTQLMLIGVLSCLVSQLFWSIGQSVTICILKIWFMAIGFGLIMGNLLAKTYRIYLIFNNKTLKSVVIEDKTLIYFSLSIMLLEIIFLSIYSFTGGLPSPVIFYDTFNPLDAYVQCRVDSDFVQLWGIITILLLNGILIICGGIVAFITRKVDSSYNESKHIASVTFLYLLACALSIPLYYSSPETVYGCKTQFLIRTIAIMMCLLGTLFILFLPIVVSVEREKIDRKKQITTDGSEYTEPMSYFSDGSETLTDSSDGGDEDSDDNGDNSQMTTGTTTNTTNTESPPSSSEDDANNSDSFLTRAIRQRKSQI